MTMRISYSPVEAAKVLGVSRAYMYVLLARGEIPARKIGTRTLIAAADL
jgi:excisionase family DNA binding protein